MSNETVSLSPIGNALRSMSEGAYFIPKSVQEMFKDRKSGPLFLINPWKTKKDIVWWVFPCPKEERDHLKETLKLDITHIFVSDKFTFNDVFHNSLFNYKIGQFDEKRNTWRWVDPSANEDKAPKLTSHKPCTLLNTWSKEDRMGSSWWS
jgi:hypothetical protein